jgi:hypothetical protein
MDRELESVLEEPQQRLAHAAELGELLVGQMNGLLHAAIGRLLETVVIRLHEPNRRRNDQLATLGHLPPRLE